jgi:hypothetical protein
MIAAEAQSRTVTAGEHLRLVQLLGRELERAMNAIARNDLPELEDSIANQQAVSFALGELAQQLGTPIAPSDFSASPENGWSEQIRRAVQELQKLNLRYSLLLQHSSRSAAQMAALFRGQFQEGSGPRSKHQTWSCRV